MYFCMCCEKHYTEDNMVIYKFNTRRGFCRECANKTTYGQRKEMENGGKQLSLFEKFISPLPY